MISISVIVGSTRQGGFQKSRRSGFFSSCISEKGLKVGLSICETSCEAMQSYAEKPAFTAFERLFQERRLPRAIRSDNGVPFASPKRAVQSFQALGLVAATGYQHRAH